MQRIADWLEKLDLGQYAQRFAENEFDVSVLRLLTDDDLKELGVSWASSENIRRHQSGCRFDTVTRCAFFRKN